MKKKIILCNLAKGSMGDFEAKAFGRLVVCLLQGIAKRKAEVEGNSAFRCICFAMSWKTSRQIRCLKSSGKAPSFV